MKRRVKMTGLLVGSVAIFVGLAGVQAQDHAGLLLGGVNSIEFGKSVPGRLEVSDGALGFLMGLEDGGVIGAAGALGKGRCVAYTHGSFLKGGLLENESGVRLLTNSVRWAGRGMKVRVGVAPGLDVLEEKLKEARLTVMEMAPEEVSGEKVDVYCVIGHEEQSDEAFAGLRGFVEGGGGLVVASTPWAFGKKYPEFTTAFPGNRLVGGSGISFLPVGIVKTGETMAVTAPVGEEGGKTVVASSMIDLKVGDGAMSEARAVKAALRLAEEGRKINGDEREELIGELGSGLELEGDDLLGFRDALMVLDGAIGPVIPTEKEPVSEKRDALAFEVVRLQAELGKRLPAAEIRAIPAADEYPGAVPEDAERVTKTMIIDTSPKKGIGGGETRRLVSTGLYAVPGEVVRVTVPAKAAEAGFGVSIGAYHIPLIGKKDEWKRYPILMREFKVTERVTEAAQGMGGLVLIAVPRNAGMDEVEMTIEGVVRAPLFELGKTSVEEWKETIRDYPAPWAELGSSRIVFMLPSSFVRDLDNPDEVMEFWTTVVDKAAELLVIDRNEIRAERVSVERQLALGSLHSGYPIGSHIKGFGETVTDLSDTKRWGIFHELGHNHQRPMWYLPGTTETTCNLWSVLLSEELLGVDRSEAHGSLGELNRRQRFMAYVNGGKPFEEEWKVWTALEMYLQLQKAFGWEAYQTVFDEYNRLEAGERPKEQQEKNDQWMIRFSKAVDRNLGPFFRAWNIPVTEAALAEISGLPAWEEDPMVKYR